MISVIVFVALTDESHDNVLGAPFAALIFGTPIYAVVFGIASWIGWRIAYRRVGVKPE